MSLFKRKPKKYELRITYRSGVQYDVICAGWRVTADETTGEITELTLDDIDGKRCSLPRFTNLKAVESIWQLP